MDILDKINKATLSLKENDSEYKEKETKYTKLTYEFFKGLTEEQIIQFDNIIDLVGDMQKDELIVAYNTAKDDMRTSSINNDFSIPYYVFEEIIEYYQRGKPITKWHNAIALMNMAKVNDRFTESQVERLIDMCK